MPLTIPENPRHPIKGDKALRCSDGNWFVYITPTELRQIADFMEMRQAAGALENCGSQEGDSEAAVEFSDGDLAVLFTNEES